MHRRCPRARPWVQWKVRESWMMVSDIYNSSMVEGMEGFQIYTLLFHDVGGALVKVG